MGDPRKALLRRQLPVELKQAAEEDVFSEDENVLLRPDYGYVYLNARTKRPKGGQSIKRFRDPWKVEDLSVWEVRDPNEVEPSPSDREDWSEEERENQMQEKKI